MKQNNYEILRIENFTVQYCKNKKQFTALHNISFTLKKSEIVCILGESGSGKSSLAKGLIGILPESAEVKGKIKIFPDIEFELEDKFINWDKIRAKRIGYIFQDSQQALNPMMKIKNQFKESLLYHKVADKNEIYGISKQYLEYLNFKDSERVLNSYPFELSGGMCQRVCIALCLCLKPDIIIADEITSALDVINQMEIINLLKRIKKELGLAVLFITHDIAVATLIADNVIVMNKGLIEEEGDIKEVFRNPKSSYTKELIDSRNEILHLKSKEIEFDNTKPLLEVKNINKQYKGNKYKTLKEVSFTINESEVVGILGESGSGKSTLVKCIMGIEKVDEGTILFEGKEIDFSSTKEKRKIYRKIQLIFQDARNCLNPRRKATKLLNEPQDYMKLYTKEKSIEQRKYLLEEVGIDSIHFSSIPPQLSTGQCQRLAIARALMVKPTLLICDEAVSALDVRMQLQILQLLLEIRDKYNVALLMISHDIQLLKCICNKIVVIKDGIVSEIIDDIGREELNTSAVNSHIDKLLTVADKIEKTFYRAKASV